MKVIRVLFVCIHNSARSQMAEAYLQSLGQGKYEVESAGLEPGTLNLNVVKVMAEDGIDISKNSCDSVFDFLAEERKYDFVITVCDETNGERCPLFPGILKREHWGFEDPSGLAGTEEKKLSQSRLIRDQIKERIMKFMADT